MHEVDPCSANEKSEDVMDPTPGKQLGSVLVARAVTRIQPTRVVWMEVDTATTTPSLRFVGVRRHSGNGFGQGSLSGRWELHRTMLVHGDAVASKG